MLILSVRTGEGARATLGGAEVTFAVLEVHRGRVKLGVEGAREVRVSRVGREEIARRAEERRAAAAKRGEEAGCGGPAT